MREKHPEEDHLDVRASWDLLLKKQVVWGEPCRVASAMATDQDVIGPRGRQRSQHLSGVQPQMPHSSPVRISAVPSYSVGSAVFFMFCSLWGRNTFSGVSRCCWRQKLTCYDRNNPPSFVQLCTQLCTAGVKCALNAVPLGKIWPVKQEEYQLLRRETELMRPGC